MVDNTTVIGGEMESHQAKRIVEDRSLLAMTEQIWNGHIIMILFEVS